MDYETLLVRQEGEALWVTLNRPERMNALNATMIAEIKDLFRELAVKREARVVVLGAAGKTFSSGIDLAPGAQGQDASAEPPVRSVKGSLDRQHSFAEIVTLMRHCPQPIIAMVQGPAVGLGFAVTLACDVRIGTPTTRMNAAFARIGLSACDIGVSYFLPRMIGTAAASEFMLTARFIGAERARELGLLSKIVPPEELESEARGFVKDMLNLSPLGLRLTKDALNYTIDMPGLEAVIAMEDRNQVLCSGAEDHREGIRAVLEKRDPVWTQP